MEDRIKIGDEWYVKESTLQTDVEAPLIEEDDILTGYYSVFENEDFCFEGSHDIDTGQLDMIVFTDKRIGEYPYTKTETWDNELWFASVLKGIPNAFDDFDDDLIISYTKEFVKQVYNLYKK